MASGAAKNSVGAKAFSQSLLVADGTFKLDYASVIFVDPVVQIDETYSLVA